MIDHTHRTDATSWVPGAESHPDFPVQNLPLGVFSLPGGTRRIGTAIGDQVLDLHAVAEAGLVPEALLAETLNPLFACDPEVRSAVRHTVFALLTDRAWQERGTAWLLPARRVTMHVPFAIGDYTDFYVGIHHATAIGMLFRPENPLLPNYRHVPIGYHGRASSVQVSGTAVTRPRGQIVPPQSAAPIHAPCRRLDYEVELGVWIAGANGLGETIALHRAWDRIAGISLLNDWSARDIQAWEYQPLGPFLSKSFLTTVSPWVVTAEALAPFRVAQPARQAGDPEPLPYLQDPQDQAAGALSIEVSASLSTAAMRAAGIPAQTLGQANTIEAMYWTLGQIITHHASNGCNLSPGDLLGTGTLSGAGPGGEGSLMELSQGGKRPFRLPGGEERCFLEDGDEVVLSARATREGFRAIGFGTCSGLVTAAR